MQFGRGGESEDMSRCFDADLLIIDDLGTELTNQFTVSVLYDIVDTRINARKSTMISTNLNHAELRKRYWDRVTSRLFGEYKPLLFDGIDVREWKIRHQAEKS
jgi:DNA replication protein DnaC